MTLGCNYFFKKIKKNYTFVAFKIGIIFLQLYDKPPHIYMALNYIWILFFVIAFLVAIGKFIFLGNTDIFKILVDSIFDTSKVAVMEIAFPLTGTMVFFMGMLNIAEKANIIQWFAQKINPLICRLFPEVPNNHPAVGHIVMNIAANFLGLDNAATPFGLKAMESLQTLNPTKDTASNAQIMFLVLHTSGLTLIPLSIMAYRATENSCNPAGIFIPCVLATLCTTVISALIVGIKQRLRFDAVLATYLIAVIGFISLLLGYVYTLPTDADKQVFSKVFGNFILLFIIVTFLVTGFVKKINVFDAFIEGAKNGFDIILKILPYLVGMLVSIKLFRECGALEYVVNGILWCINQLGINNEFAPALPIAIMKPFSSSGARGLMLDNFKTYGVDSFVGNLSSIFQGSSDTTFYIVALYFGSVGIKKVRYAIWAGLFADFLGVILAIIIAYLWTWEKC